MEVKDIAEYEENDSQLAKYTIAELHQEVDKYKRRCYEALKLIRDNYGLLDKYGIDMLDDILNGSDKE